MSTANSSNKAAKRAAQREELRKKREAELKRQQRIRVIVITLVSIAALALAAGLGYLLFQAFKPQEPLPDVTPQSVSADTPYLSVGPDSGAPKVDIVLDFMCPFCGEFETKNGDDIAALVANGEASVNFYIRSFLNGASGTEYSGRAAGASVCTYEQSPDLFLKFQAALFENQPAKGTPGHSDAELAAFAEELGASQATLECINNRNFQRFAQDVLEPAGANLSASTPAVFVNGEQFDGDWRIPGALTDVIREAPATE